MLKVFYDTDANLDVLKSKKIAIIGYGSQGRAQALCMKDSGLSVIIGVRKNGASWSLAKKDGMQVETISDAARQADIIHILIPDEVHGEVYKNEIEKHLNNKKTLAFSHGFSIVFSIIKPPKIVDVLMVSPRAPGIRERELFLKGSGVPCSIAVHQDYSGHAKETALAMAKACGFTRIGAMETTFENETIGDLFGEQAVLCGGVSELIKKAYETLVESGYPPEMAYLDCLYELKLVVEIICGGGLEHMWQKVSNTAEYGGRTRGKRIIDEEAKKRMKAILEEIKSGAFAKEWMDEYKKGLPKLKKMREDGKKHTIEKTGMKIRESLKKRSV